MAFTLDNAVVYDIETFPNAFTLNAVSLHTDDEITFEISEYRDDRQYLINWFNWLNQTQTGMIGFNSVNFDYVVCHLIYTYPNCTIEEIYAKAMDIINGQNRFAHTIWANNRFAPQIDLFKIHHFDNKAKSTSLKALQFNMRSESVVESTVPFGTRLSPHQIAHELIPYNRHDTKETKQFAHHSMSAINFRIGLIDQFGIEVLNYNDTKIGEEMMISRIGKEHCFDYVNGRRQKRQTVRHQIPLKDVVFPYVYFKHPEFQRVLDYLNSQVLLPDEYSDSTKVKTKGVFAGLKASIDGFDFCYGVGGIHGSINAQKIVAGNGFRIRDIDVASLYPSVGIVNNLAPEHLGEAFTQAYSTIPPERKEWQKKKGKKCQEANTLKLAANGTYGKTNDEHSVFFDPKYTMTTTINGQLMLSMLAEWLWSVPTFKIIQINTDGITYFIHDDYEPQAAAICKQWEAYTCLVLEDAEYSRMWIRDVNNYIAESPDGSLKQKGAYWHPDPLDYAASISNAQPPAWHKDLSCVVVQRAAVMAMVHGIDPGAFIRAHTDPFDFMLRAKVGRADRLLHGENEVQRITRYYVSTDGSELRKVSPPNGPIGEFKRANNVSDYDFHTISATLAPGQHDPRIHTKNKSRYVMREFKLQAGYKTSICNNAADFSFSNVNYDWYISEARKLIIS